MCVLLLGTDVHATKVVVVSEAACWAHIEALPCVVLRVEPGGGAGEMADFLVTEEVGG